MAGRRIITRPPVQVALILTVFGTIHYLFFVRRFLRGDIVMGGDTQMLWSFHYMFMYSLVRFRELLWWDPTAYNGWPAYFFWISGWVNYFSPYAIPSVILAWVGTRAIGLDINTALVLQKSVYYFLLNLLAVTLITRELVKSQLARILPPLIFALSAITFHGFRDAVLYEGLPAPLFYVFALIHFNNRRTRASFFMLLLFSGMFAASLSYAFLQSSLYWTAVFSALLLVLYPDLLVAFARHSVQVWRTAGGKVALLTGALFLGSALLAFYLPVHYNLGRVYRVSGSGPVNYDVSLAGDFQGPDLGIVSYQSWNNFLMWAPFSELHEFSMKFDPWAAGIDHRYLGLATLPLLLVAMIRGPWNRYAMACLMTSVICGAFVIYTVRNLAFSILLDGSDVFKNVRTMANTMPREGPSLFIMFAAGIGLDLLIDCGRGGQAMMPTGGERVDRVLRAALGGVIAIAAICGLLVAVPALHPIQHTLGHVAIYLGLFAGISLLLLLAREPRVTNLLVAMLLALAFMDLTISASSYWDRGKVWFVNQGPHRLPKPVSIGPIKDESEAWAGSYRGIVHNPAGGPWYGLKEWLVLVSRPQWQAVLGNWNQANRLMRAYPDFRFYTNGRVIPFEEIRRIDDLAPPAAAYSTIIDRPGRRVLVLADKEFPIQDGLAGFVEQAEQRNGTVTARGWAIDEVAVAPAKKVVVFAGNRLWISGSPTEERADIAALGLGYRRSGFTLSDVLPGSPKPSSVRAFAILSNGTARELRYSSGYPFSTAVVPPLERSEAPVYLHDEALVNSRQGPGESVDVHWRVLEFRPNRVRVATGSARESVMVHLDNYDRFWTARVDGQEAPIYRANFTFKAIRLPAGEHQVEWIYDPYPIKRAWVFFYLSFAAFVAAWVWWARSSTSGRRAEIRLLPETRRDGDSRDDRDGV